MLFAVPFLIACGGEEAAKPAEPVAPPPAAEPAAPAAPAPVAAAGVPAAHWPAPAASPVYSCVRQAEGWCGEYSAPWVTPGDVAEKNMCEMNGGVWAEAACARENLFRACDDSGHGAKFFAINEAGMQAVKEHCTLGTLVEKP